MSVHVETDDARDPTCDADGSVAAVADAALPVAPQGPYRGPSRLAQLRLTAKDLAALKRQGTVLIERRGTKCVAKLRFRSGGRQVVRYLGGAEAAREVRVELATIQAAHRQARELARITRSARKAIRAWKTTLAPYLEKHGYSFYGFQIRRQRKPRTLS